MRLTWPALLCLAACAGSPPARTAAPPPATRHQSVERRQSAEPDPWESSSFEERHDTMTWGLLPNMARLLQRFQNHPYPDLTCRTCHGKGAEAHGYPMPAALPPLEPDPLPSEKSEDPSTAKVAKFMASQVVPLFAEITGKRGVSCFTCHPRKEAP